MQEDSMEWVEDQRSKRMKEIQAANIEKVREWYEFFPKSTTTACMVGTGLSYPTVKKAMNFLAANQGVK
jgi:Na+/citrate or Na+/malate symporter